MHRNRFALIVVSVFIAHQNHLIGFESVQETIVERDDAVRQAVQAAIDELDETMVPDFLRWEHNGKPAGNNWNRSQHNAEWGVDYYNRISTSRSKSCHGVRSWSW